MPDTIQPDPLNATCPVCHAAPGESCMDARRRDEVLTHEARGKADKTKADDCWQADVPLPTTTRAPHA